MIQIILLHAILGTSVPICKILLQNTTPAFLASIRMLFAGTLLSMHYWIMGGAKKKSFSINNISLYLQLIVVGGYLKYILRAWGLDHMPASKMAFLLNMGPFVAALFSYIVYNERLTKNKWIGLIIGFCGFIPILLTTSQAELSFGEFLYISWPELSIIGAICAHNYGMMIMRTLLRDHKYTPRMINSIRMAGGGLLGMSILFMSNGIHLPITHPTDFWPLLTFLVVCNNLIFHNIYISLLKTYSITFLAFTDFLSPLFAAFYSWLFLGEIITWHYYVSAVIVLIGLTIFYQQEMHERSRQTI